jgi:methionyl-tRNA formyltransferase
MRLFLLCPPSLDEFFAAALAAVLDAPDVDVVGALVEVPDAVPAARKLRQELRKGRGGYVVVMAAGRAARRVRGGGVPAGAFLAERGVPHWPAPDLYAPQALARIRAAGPDSLFRSGFGIIREPVLSLAPKGVLSYHHGDMRRYRGQPPAFWELFHGERRMKVTVQVLGAGLDAGSIVLERAVEIGRGESWRSLERRAYALSSGMLLDACRRVAEPGFVPEPVPERELGDLYTLPNLRQWLTLQGRVAIRRVR